MAGLNDDVDDGLDAIIDEPDYNPNAADAPAILLANKITSPTPADNDINTVPPSRLFGGPIVPNELPNLNAAFLITTNHVTSADDIASVRSSVSTNCSVCREDAEVIDSLMPGFINDDRPLGYFTDKKTKTQYAETLASLDTSIESKTAVLIATALDTIETLVQKYRDIKTKAESNLSTNLIRYQLALTSIVVMANDEDTSQPIKDFINNLNEVLPRGIQNHLSGDVVGGVCVQALLPQLQKEDFLCNLTNVVCRDLDLVTGRNLFMSNGQIYELTETEPYLVPPSAQVQDANPKTSFNRSITASDYLYGGVDMYSLNYMQTLLNMTTSLTEAMVKSAGLIEDASKNVDITPKERLNLVSSLVCLSNDYARNNHNIFSFMDSYFTGFDWLVETMMDMSNTSAIKQ